MIQTGYDLPLALSICGRLGTGWDHKACAGGAFMENINTRFGYRSAWLDDADALYPCRRVAVRDQRSCYLRASWRILVRRERLVRGDRGRAVPPSVGGRARASTATGAMPRSGLGTRPRRFVRSANSPAAARPTACRGRPDDRERLRAGRRRTCAATVPRSSRSVPSGLLSPGSGSCWARSTRRERLGALRARKSLPASSAHALGRPRWRSIRAAATPGGRNHSNGYSPSG